MWSSCPWVSTTASIRSRRSRRYWKSGSTRSIPGISTSGNDKPASITRTRPSSSSAAMLRPTSPTPPRKTSRARGSSEGAGIPHGLLDRGSLVRGRGDEGKAKRPGRSAHDLEGGLDGDGVRRDEQALEQGQELLVDLARRGDVAGRGELDHLVHPLPRQMRRDRHHAHPAQADERERRPVVARVHLEVRR